MINETNKLKWQNVGICGTNDNDNGVKRVVNDYDDEIEIEYIQEREKYNTMCSTDIYRYHKSQCK